MSTEPKIDTTHRSSADDSHHEGHGKADHVAAAKADKGSDISAQWLETYTGPRPQIDDIANKLVRNRIDRFLMPICFYIYFCQQLDKSSVSLVSPRYPSRAMRQCIELENSVTKMQKS